MATDGDRHQLGDPITRMTDGNTSAAPSLADARPPNELSEEELRREIANLDVIIREAPVRGTAEAAVAASRDRLDVLEFEYQRRTSSNR